jgi:hypothetical protein
MPKKYAKRLTLHPLSFEDAVKAIVSVDPDPLGITLKRCKQRKPQAAKSKHPPKLEQDINAAPKKKASKQEQYQAH